MVTPMSPCSVDAAGRRPRKTTVLGSFVFHVSRGRVFRGHVSPGRPAAAAVAASVLAATALTVTAAAAATTPTSVHVNFQPATAAVPAGYTADTGKALAGGSGWEDAGGAPLDLTPNTRVRHSAASPDARYDTLLLMQAPAGSGTTTPGRWVAPLADGTYTVTVAVGDPTATNSVDELTAQPGTPDAVTLVDHFVPTSTTLWQTVTKQVTVSGGQLVLDPAGGSNTKIDYVDAVPVTSGAGHLTVSSPDDATLGLPASRLVFSTEQAQANPPAKAFTFANTGGSPVTVSGLALGGTDAASFALAPGQPTTFTIPAGGSATAGVVFTPTAPTGCPASGTALDIGNVTRDATLGYSSDDPTSSSGSLAVSGIVACGFEGNFEPVLDQVVHALGYTTTVVAPGANRRFLGASRRLAGTDEVAVPYFVQADTSQPVTLTPVAHYSGAYKSSGGFQNTGWYARGATMATPCNASCTKLWSFPSDTSNGYVQNQKLLPVPTGTTAFTPSGAFGIWSGDYSGVNYSDDGLNLGEQPNGAVISPPHYLHDLRTYPAFGPNHVQIPNTWVIGIDITRVPAYKNYDSQDVVLVLHNAAPATALGAQPGSATTHNLAAGGTVTSACGVTGFDGVLPNTAGTQCNAANIAFSSGGLALTSSAGQLANGDQQNALYDAFDASRGQFTVKARLLGPVSYLTNNYQQAAAFFGPDQSNFVKVEVEHNGGGADPHLTMFYDEKGTAGTVATVSLPAVTTASTLDLVIRGNTQVPDPVSGTADAYKVHNYPLDQLTAYYSLNGGALVQVGTVESPADVTRWFSTSALAGVLVSGAGSTVPVTATFSSFAVTAP